MPISRVRGATRIVSAPLCIGTATMRTPYTLGRIVATTVRPARTAAAAVVATVSNATSNGAEPNVASGVAPSHEVSATG